MNHSSLVQNGLSEVRVGPSVVLDPLDDPPPGLLILGQNLRIVCGRLDGSLGQIVGCLDIVDKVPGSPVVLAVLPAAHRLLQPVVVHLDDGEELRGLLCQQVVQLSVMLRPILGNLGFTSF